MIFILPTNKSKFIITLTIQTDKQEEICVVGKDTRKSNSTYYFRRKGKVNGKRKFVLRFPLSPDVMELKVYNLANGCAPRDEDKSFKVVDFKVHPLVESDVWMSPETASFVKFAKEFCVNLNYLTPALYKSDDGQYAIKLLDQIRASNGAVMSTPARVEHSTGLIEISKSMFATYSVPMRMIVLLHEYSHKYMNHIVDRPINDEQSADINALYIYLGLGFPRIEAITAFGEVFMGNATKGNNKRLKIVNDFITKFEQGKFD